MLTLLKSVVDLPTHYSSQSVHTVTQNSVVLIDWQPDWQKPQLPWQIFSVPLYGVLTEKQNFDLLMIESSVFFPNSTIQGTGSGSY